MDVPSARALQERARRLGHWAAAACLRVARQSRATARSAVERATPAVIEALERWDAGARPRWLEAGYDFFQEWRRILVGVLIGTLLSTACYWAWSTWRARQVEELASVA